MAIRIRTAEEIAMISAIMNDIKNGETIVSHAVPTRALRVVLLRDDKTFRVQQLNPNNREWTTLSTHAGDEPWEAWVVAMQDCHAKQAQLQQELLRQKVEMRQAERVHAASARPTRDIEL